MFSMRVTRNIRRSSFIPTAYIKPVRRAPRRSIGTQPEKVDIEALLKTPSWSVRKTLLGDQPCENVDLINSERLHHLLRLSGLPLPASAEEEAKMIGDLKAHLRFVEAIQKVDTDGVEPLQMIRDETEGAEQNHKITMDSLKQEFEKEEILGRRGRIRKKPTEKEPKTHVKTETWNPLSHAKRTQGPYFVVDTAKD